jgi:glucosamine kinase
MDRIVIGIDGGGTLTRALAVDLSGCVLASLQTGGSNPSHNPEARTELRAAITACVERAGRTPGDVAFLVAGLAGLDSEADRASFDAFTQIDGLVCPRLLVNDAIVAHAAALRSRPGIIVIAGTGSIIVAVTADGRVVRNYDFNHHAPCAARHLGYAAVFQILAGQPAAEDRPMVEQILGQLKLADVAALRLLIATNVGKARDAPNREIAELAPLITAAADGGSPLAIDVCATAVRTVAIGVGLVAGSMRCDGDVPTTIDLALIGSVARSPVIRKMLLDSLAKQANISYREVTPAFKPAGGAALMALQRAGVEVTDELTDRLLAHADARF